MNARSLHSAWLRASVFFTNAHHQLEDELVRMRDKKLPQELIDRKDEQIEQLVNFFNQTDELVQAYRHELAQARIENHFLTDMLTRKIQLNELLQYKPSKKVEIFNTESGINHTLSELNG